VAAGKLFVADTNNHCIRTIDLRSLQMSTLTIDGLKPPQPLVASTKRPAGNREKLPLTVVRADQGQVRLQVELAFPPGYKINPLAPLEYRLSAQPAATSGAGPVVRTGFDKPVRIEKPAGEFEICLPVSGQSGRDVVSVAVDYYYCRDGAEGICKVGSAEWLVPLELSTAAKDDIVHLRHRVK